MRTCFKEPSMTMTTWTLWLWLFPRCRRTNWVRRAVRYRERVGGGVTNKAIACQCSYSLPSTWPTLIRHDHRGDGCRRLKIVLKFYNYRWSEDKLQLGTILGTFVPRYLQWHCSPGTSAGSHLFFSYMQSAFNRNLIWARAKSRFKLIQHWLCSWALIAPNWGLQ